MLQHNQSFTQWAERSEYRQNHAIGPMCTHCGSPLHEYRGEQNVIRYRIPIYQCHSCDSSFGGERRPVR